MAARPRRLTLSRRGLLASLGASGLLLGCGADPDEDDGTDPLSEPGDPSAKASAAGTPGSKERIRYGDDHGSQFADLRMPTRDPLATVVLLHGGYWYPDYGLDLMDPLAERFTDLGYATWNVEYRRTGAGGGVPQTLSDVAAAVDRLAEEGLPPGLTEKVVVVGHSAGGHLAAWVASRTDQTPGGAAAFPLAGAVSLSGVLDLTRAATTPGSQDPVTAFVGGSPDEVPERYAVADPTLLVPPSCPVWAVQATEDEVVPREQAISYVDHARQAKGDVEYVPVPGDHLAVIDPGSAAFRTIGRLVTEAAATR